MRSKAKEFIQLMQTAGWSQAEAARRLHITPGAVSQICNGKTQPREATLNLLKLIIPRGEEIFTRGTARHRLMPWEAALLNKLRRLPRNRRDQLLAAIHQLINLAA